MSGDTDKGQRIEVIDAILDSNTFSIAPVLITVRLIVKTPQILQVVEKSQMEKTKRATTYALVEWNMTRVII